MIIKDIEENEIVKITDDTELLQNNFVMHATTPAELIFGLVDNDPKQALEPTLI